MLVKKLPWNHIACEEILVAKRNKDKITLPLSLSCCHTVWLSFHRSNSESLDRASGYNVNLVPQSTED